jgi:hypothetical protein
MEPNTAFLISPMLDVILVHIKLEIAIELPHCHPIAIIEFLN